MTRQTEISLPPRPANDILREKIAELEARILAAEKLGDHAACGVLLRERTRLQRIIRGTLDQNEKPA